jgi:hypothetical protein
MLQGSWDRGRSSIRAANQTMIDLLAAACGRSVSTCGQLPIPPEFLGGRSYENDADFRGAFFRAG